MFNQKETTFLQDLKHAEQLCTEKYQQYAQKAVAPQLQQLFQQIGQQEQQHLQTLDQMLTSGAPVGMGMSGSSSGSTAIGGQTAGCYPGQNQAYQNDSFLCNDALAMEKHVSANYNTSIFEFRDQTARDTLNHIQKEEQAHGKMIYDFMAANGMYN